MTVLRNTLGVDSQRSRVYKAENKAFAPLLKSLRDVSTPESYLARVTEIMGSRYMARVFPQAVRAGAVSVKVTRRLRGARAGFSGITTNPRSMKEHILLHELSHTVIRRCWPATVIRGEDGRNYRSAREVPRGLGYGRHYVVGHGPEFARVYLSLVRRFIGRTAYLALRDSFETHRVRFAPKRGKYVPKRIVSETARKARAEGLRRKVAEKLRLKLNARGSILWRIRGRDVLAACTPLIGRTTHYEIIYRGKCTARLAVGVDDLTLYEAVKSAKAQAEGIERPERYPF